MHLRNITESVQKAGLKRGQNPAHSALTQTQRGLKKASKRLKMHWSLFYKLLFSLEKTLFRLVQKCFL